MNKTVNIDTFETNLIDTKFDVHWYCPYCNEEKSMTNNQWQKYLLTHKWGEDHFPYCNNRHKFLNSLRGKE